MNPPSQARLARIAIVGRPNVGKSTLLNRMARSRVSIVEPTAGVTRDRIAVPVRLNVGEGDRWVEVIDTGGIGIVDRDDLGPHVEEQVRVALAGADMVLFMVDVRDGVTPLDQEVARRLRSSEIPVLLVVNKLEADKFEWDVDAFRKLGRFDGPYAISAQNGGGLEDLYIRILEGVEASDELPEIRAAMKLAVVGRRNAGKSTLINQLAREERMIVSEIPGTTRDAVDVLFERDGRNFVAIDTAGVRKKKSMAHAVEFYSDARSRRSIRRADVVLLLFDVTEPLASLDKHLARSIVDQHKPVVLGANKWDLVGDRTPEDFRAYLDAQMPGMNFAPISFLSGKTGHNVDRTVQLAIELYEQASQRVSTGELNRILEKAMESRSPSSRGHRVKIRYATQASILPPTFVLFVNDRRLFGKDYIRYLVNRLREGLGLEEVPLRIQLRDKTDRDTFEE